MSENPLDDGVANWVVDNRTEPWITLAHALTQLGNTLTLTVIVAIVAGVLFARGRRIDALVLAGGSLLGAIVVFVVKLIVGRERPPADERLLEIGSLSFPSGHALGTTVVAGLLAVVAFRSLTWVRAHRWVLAAAPVAAIVVGLTRIYLGVHWTTDVLAGWIMGALLVWVIGWSLRRWSVTTDMPSQRG